MNIGFIGMNLNFGGGKIVGLKIIENWLKTYQVNNLFAILPDDVVYREIWKKNNGWESNVWWVKKNDSSRMARLKSEIFKRTNKWIKKNNIEVIFNATNLPIISPPCKQILLLHRAFLVAPTDLYDKNYDKKIIRKIKFEKVIFRYLSNHVDTWVVQSNFMKELLTNELNILDNKVEVIPSGSFGPLKIEGEGYNKDKTNSKTNNIFVPTKSYDHKPINSIKEIVKFLPEDLDYKFILTLAEEDASDNLLIKSFEEEINKGKIKNVGRLSIGEMDRHYRGAKLVYMPTLLESYGLTFVEAMTYGIPIITFDKPFTKELCGDAAVYIKDNEYQKAALKIEEILKNEKMFCVKSKLSINRANKVAIDWSESAGRLLETVIKDVK